MTGRHMQPEQSVSLDPERYQFRAWIDVGVCAVPVASAATLDPLMAWCSWSTPKFNTRIENVSAGVVCAARDVGEGWE